MKSGDAGKHDRPLTIAPFVGIQLSVDLTDWFQVHGRLSSTFTTKVGFGTGELGFLVHPVPHVGLMGGYRIWRYHKNRGFSDDSQADFRLTLSGPSAGLRLDF